MEHDEKNMGNIKEIREGLTSQEINYLNYLRAKALRKEHWIAKKYRMAV